jgi:hypothetical protein
LAKIIGCGAGSCQGKLTEIEDDQFYGDRIEWPKGELD